MTAEERIDELGDDDIRATLAKIIRIVDEGGTMANVADVLNDWSLIEGKPDDRPDPVAGA